MAVTQSFSLPLKTDFNFTRFRKLDCIEGLQRQISSKSRVEKGSKGLEVIRALDKNCWIF